MNGEGSSDAADALVMASESPDVRKADQPSPTSDEDSQPQHQSFLLLHNIGKRSNWGSLLRSASAFGVSEVLVVGERKLKTFGNQGTLPHLQFRYFNTLEAAVEWLHARDITLIGVEIVDEAIPVHHPQAFERSSCIMLGNEGTGMTAKQLQMCDRFVYTPQYGGGTASLNVTVAGSIVLHHFAIWAGFREGSRTGHKFDVAPVRSKLEQYERPTDQELAERMRLRDQRSARRQFDGDEGADGCGLVFVESEGEEGDDEQDRDDVG
ncbi:unnamed protein product [Vitrella brassicaformis CCMP3155]|uniref:tRNA/rRNA methyltransferase SpoU type domain-containing protein n=3 Tax=Vitrella brassicaformis TaxID=1169539 RepID=A0A0G4FYE4_VITBC|nr:unnamed protein product [Vitrella brassicaformis CCMP3155]|eukprot:CEM20198.1 unnamed protein product [Vitrella brassicaformis CCMP3155]